MIKSRRMNGIRESTAPAVPEMPGKTRSLAPEDLQVSKNVIHDRAFRLWPLLTILLIAGLGVLPLVAQQQQADRVKTIGGKFLCMCNCGQILTQCNHVGCTMSADMLKELGTWVNRGDSEDVITQAFVLEYGTTVYAEPPKSGFSLVAWAMPVVYFLLGLALVVVVITKWRRSPRPAADHVAGQAGVSEEVMQRARAQAARDTED
jgi:cytochrome c-type biogenesis protein CcmH